MTFDQILLVLLIGGATVFYLTRWLPTEVTSLLIIAGLGLTGILDPSQALSGFSSTGLVTVAANLDPEAWTLHHELSPLVGSLDPVAQAGRLRGLPQMHLAGSDDRVVPAYTRGRFLAAAGTEQRIVEGASHGCCWVDSWPRPLCRFLADAAVAAATAVDSSTTNCR